MIKPNLDPAEIQSIKDEIAKIERSLQLAHNTVNVVDPEAPLGKTALKAPYVQFWPFGIICEPPPPPPGGDDDVKIKHVKAALAQIARLLDLIRQSLP